MDIQFNTLDQLLDSYDLIRQLRADRKRCSSCKTWNLRSEFSLDRSSHDRLQGNCRSCSNVRSMQQKREINSDVAELWTEAKEAKRAVDVMDDRFTQFWTVYVKPGMVRRQSKAASREAFIGLFLTRCPALGVEMGPGFIGSQGVWSVDRIDPSRGYDDNNVHVVSSRANTIMGAKNADQLYDYVEDLMSGRKKSKATLTEVLGCARAKRRAQLSA